MAKLTKPQIKAHREAEALIGAERPLTDDEKLFVLDNWSESANHINSAVGAFFTPTSLASDFSIEVAGGSCDSGPLIDLCAGIGCLSWFCRRPFSRIVCVENNPDYVRVGRRILPEVEWIEASIFDPKILALGDFSWAISNPPFGNIKADGAKHKYTGSKFEYRVVELASMLADFGAFIVPQMSAPFRYSGEQRYREDESEDCRKFREQTGIVMETGCGIDTSIYKGDWRGVSPTCEIVVCEFERRSVESSQLDLFGIEEVP